MLPRVPFSECIRQWESPALVDNYYSAAAQRKTQAHKTTRFASFPPYLFVQLRRCGWRTQLPAIHLHWQTCPAWQAWGCSELG